MPHLPSLDSRATIQSSLFYKVFSFLFLKLDSGSHLTVTLFVGLTRASKGLAPFLKSKLFHLMGRNIGWGREGREREKRERGKGGGGGSSKRKRDRDSLRLQIQQWERGRRDGEQERRRERGGGGGGQKREGEEEEGDTGRGKQEEFQY